VTPEELEHQLALVGEACDDPLASAIARSEIVKAWNVRRDAEREKTELIKMYAGPSGMTPEDVTYALGRAKSLWTCNAGHVVYVDPDVPPYEMAPCPLCRADEERREWAEIVGSTTAAEGLLAVGKELIRLRQVEAAAKETATCPQTDTITCVGGVPPAGAAIASWLRIPGLPQLLASAVLEDGGPGRDPDYTWRNRYLLIAVGAAAASGVPVGFRFDPKEPDWPVVYFELPTGQQVSWHLPRHEREYDGHSTPEKNQRIDAWLAQIEAGGMAEGG
jgi:hypothetical protein